MITDEQITEISEALARRGMGVHLIDGRGVIRAIRLRKRREHRWGWLLERLGLIW